MRTISGTRTVATSARINSSHASELVALLVVVVEEELAAGVVDVDVDVAVALDVVVAAPVESVRKRSGKAGQGSGEVGKSRAVCEARREADGDQSSRHADGAGVSDGDRGDDPV